MPLFRLNPITRKRLWRFRQIKRGYYSLIILATCVFLSLFSEFLANNRPVVLSYNGSLHFPTFKFYKMMDFGQTDPEGYDDEQECNYRLLAKEWKDAGSSNWLIMPPIPWNPTENDFSGSDQPPHPPNFEAKHYLGTDTQGRDVAARLLYGFRISILFALTVVAIGYTIGTIVGSLQGFAGGWVDLVAQRGIEIWSTLPFLYIVIILGSLYTPSFKLLLLIMVLFEWIGITFYMRTEIYREKSKEYCLAAKSMGASNWRIVFKHLLPNSLTPLVTKVPFAVVAGISALTSLDYLGYGLPPPTPSWGELIDQALSNLKKPWLTFSPFAAILFTLTLVTFVGESIREAFDPKQYAKYE